jgi:hypothetical protein
MTPRRTLTARDRRALLLGALVLAPVLLWSIVVRPWRDEVVRLEERLVAQRALLARERALLRGGGGPAIAMPARDSALLDAPDADAAAAALASHVAELAVDAGLRVHETEAAEASSASGAIGEVALRLRAGGTLEATMRLLAELARGPRLVQVEELALEAGAEPGAESGVLGLEARVRGYWTNASAARVALAGAPPVPRGDADSLASDVAARAPFSPTRERPGTPPPVASAPGWEAADSTAEPTRPPLRVVGTVVGDDTSSFAICRVGQERPKLVRLGETIDGRRLVRVEPGSASFLGADGARITIRVTDP